MTDTTDIEALREKYELALKDLTERLMECNRLNYCMDEITAFAAFSSTLIDQLEAERQRADEGAKEITYWCNLNARKNERMGELEAAEKERDEITTGILELIPDCRYMDPPDGGSVTPLEQLSRMVTELRAAPQKPVVLPGISELIDACYSTPTVRDVHVWDLVISEVKRLNPSLFSDKSAAGGIVKDSE